MILNERQARHDSVMAAARELMTAARTAPHARGNDQIEVAVIAGDDIARLSSAMMELFEETGRPVYQRDSGNIASADAVVLIGVRPGPMGLNCGRCGSPTCGARPEGVPCAFNAVDTGIAVGSAVSRAADLRLDTRVMWSAGMGAERLGILPGCSQVLAIPLSATSKNPFFDR